MSLFSFTINEWRGRRGVGVRIEDDAITLQRIREEGAQKWRALHSSHTLHRSVRAREHRVPRDGLTFNTQYITIPYIIIIIP